MIPEQTPASPLALQKRALRERAYSARDAQSDKEQNSAWICKAFTSLPAFQNAETILLYLSCRSEVRTRETVHAALGGEKRIVIPYCTLDDAGRNKLGLWWLESLDELIPGMWNILEPPKSRRGESGKEIDPRNLDLIMVPGVAFDVRGGRLGNGQGYYDRLLAAVRPDCELIGVGFESQIFEEIPMGSFDIRLDGVITEKHFYPGKGRSNNPPIHFDHKGHG
ncbi:MAG: 5-formyltetrahydrofolate cyclo-ligase [Methylococcales bacterium]